MKLLIYAFAALMIVSCAKKKFKINEEDVPPVVVAAFEHKYPSSSVIEWEAEKEGSDMVYEVGFKMNDKKFEAAFSPDGAFIEEE